MATRRKPFEKKEREMRKKERKRERERERKREKERKKERESRGGGIFKYNELFEECFFSLAQRFVSLQE